jgi:peptidoglycan/LPS O-acetylase OafA/YrhL
MVLIAHLAATTPGLQRVIWRFGLGNLGVRVFFVISGFLITTLLLKELSATQSISLREFYVRRFFRIVPAFYAMLAVVLVLVPFGVFSAGAKDVALAAFYISNYRIPQIEVGHSWSLAVEEQFYLMWPLALVALGRKRASFVAIALLAISPLFRLASLRGWWPTDPMYAFENVADALAVGCLLAIFRERLWSASWYRAMHESRFFLLIPLAALAPKVLQVPDALWMTCGVPLLNVAIGLTIDHYIRFPLTPVGRVLNSRPFVLCGLLSYSIYLWQQIFLLGKTQLPFPLNLACIFIVAALSFWIIEQPVQALGRRVIDSMRKGRLAAVRPLSDAPQG